MTGRSEASKAAQLELKRRRYTDPNERAKVRSYQREYQSRPEVILAQKEYRHKPEVKSKRNSKTHIHNLTKKYGDTKFTWDGSEDSEKLRVWMLDSYDKPCTYCGGVTTAADHKVPLTLGGMHSWDNLQPVCRVCNIAKHNMLEEEFLDWVRSVYEHTATKGSGV